MLSCAALRLLRTPPASSCPTRGWALAIYTTLHHHPTVGDFVITPRNGRKRLEMLRMVIVMDEVNACFLVSYVNDARYMVDGFVGATALGAASTLQ